MNEGNEGSTVSSVSHGGPGNPTGPGHTRLFLLAAAVLVLAVFAAFWPALDASFVNWDDEANLVDNPDFRGLGGTQLEWMFTRAFGGPYMPLTWLSFAVDHALWGLGEGLDAPEAALFHRTNVLLHALGALAFFGLARVFMGLVRSSASGRARTLAALVAALLFAVHPLRVESVAWLTERRDVLSGLFFVLAVGAWLRAVPRGSAPRLARGPALLVVLSSVAAALLFFASVDLSGPALSWRGSGLAGPAGFGGSVLLLLASAVLAGRAARVEDAPARGLWMLLALLLLIACFLSKALGVTLPLVLLVLDLWPLDRLRRGSALALLVEKLPLLALSVVFGALAMWGQGQLSEALTDWEHHTLGERLVQVLYGFFFYPTRTLVPVHLIPMVALPQELSLLQPRFLLAAASVLAVGAVLVLRRRSHPGPLVACLAFALLIGPVLGLSQAGAQLVADRYSYLACMPFALLAAGGWLAWSSANRSALPLAVAALVCGTSGVLTWRQTTHWRNSEALWEHMLEVAPASGLPHMLLGMLRYREGQEAAPTETERLLEEARQHFARGFELEQVPIPHYLSVYGALLIDLHRPAEARVVLKRFVDSRPDDAIGHTNLGAALVMLGRPARAVAQLEEAVRLDPEYPKAWMQLGFAYEAAGRKREAQAAFERVLTFWPRFKPARQKLRALRTPGESQSLQPSPPR